MNNLRQILYLTYFHMCSRYRKTWAGFFWVISNPILMFTVQAFVFKSIFKIQVENYPLFLFSGLLPWFFISQTLNSVTSCLVYSREVLLGFKIHPATIVASQVIDQYVSFLATFIMLGCGFLWTSSIDLGFAQLLAFTLSMILILIFIVSLTFLLSFWHVFYRDVQFVAQFLLNLTFYITPILYPESFIPAQYKFLISLNIFYPFIQLFQISLYRFDSALWLTNFLTSILITVIITALCFFSLNRKMKDFYINV